MGSTVDKWLCLVVLWSREKPCFSAPCANGGPVALTEVHVVPSRFIVRPHVAAVRLAEVLDFDVTEVAAVHRLRIEDLLDQAFQLTQRVRIGGQSGFTIEAPGFAFPDMPFIWGATAMMLGELRAILSVHGG